MSQNVDENMFANYDDNRKLRYTMIRKHKWFSPFAEHCE